MYRINKSIGFTSVTKIQYVKYSQNMQKYVSNLLIEEFLSIPCNTICLIQTHFAILSILFQNFAIIIFSRCPPVIHQQLSLEKILLVPAALNNTKRPGSLVFNSRFFPSFKYFTLFYLSFHKFLQHVVPCVFDNMPQVFYLLSIYIANQFNLIIFLLLLPALHLFHLVKTFSINVYI